MIEGYPPCVKFLKNINQVESQKLMPYSIRYEHFKPPCIPSECKRLGLNSFVNIPVDMKTKLFVELEKDGFYGVYLWQYCGDDACVDGCPHLGLKDYLDVSVLFEEYLSGMQDLFCGENRDFSDIELTLQHLYNLIFTEAMDDTENHVFFMTLFRALKGQSSLVSKVYDLMLSKDVKSAAAAIAVHSECKPSFLTLYVVR